MYKASIADAEALEEVFARERPELVNHHAAQTSVRRSMADPSFDARVNVSAPSTSCSSVSSTPSTGSSLPPPARCTPSHSTFPWTSCTRTTSSAYGAAKYAAETYIRQYADVYA